MHRWKKLKSDALNFVVNTVVIQYVFNMKFNASDVSFFQRRAILGDFYPIIVNLRQSYSAYLVIKYHKMVLLWILSAERS